LTVEKLRQYRDKKREIALLKSQICRYRQQKREYVQDVVSGSEQEFPYRPQKVHIQGYATQTPQLLQRSIRRVQHKIDRLYTDLDEVDRFIASVQDSQMRQMITLRYVEGSTWPKIAHEIGENDESFPRQKVRNYLERCGVKRS